MPKTQLCFELPVYRSEYRAVRRVFQDGTVVQKNVRFFGPFLSYSEGESKRALQACGSLILHGWGEDAGLLGLIG